MKSYDYLIRHSGNQDLFRAVEMSVTALRNGVPFHLHAEGLRGTGKTSIIRAAKDILPKIVRVKNCIYNCYPDHPHCPDHKALSKEQILELGTETIPCPFLEISHAAKIGTVVGCIDLTRLTDKMNPVAAVLPGTIPQAHRGVIFIDEINRLADTAPEIADVLLSVMGTKPGRVQIEESGLPTVDIPVSVTIWAASNPDEEPGGLTQIRRQLADRFDMVIPMGRPNDYKAVSMILDSKSTLLPKARQFNTESLTVNFTEIQSGESIKKSLATVYVDFGLESLRAVEAMEIGARLNAMLAGRQIVETQDLISVAPIVLSHRTDSGTITSILKYLESLYDTNSKEFATETVSLVNTADLGKQAPSSETYLQKLWKNIKKLFSNPNQSGASSALSQNNRPANSQSNDSMRGGPQRVPADPLQTDINAPVKLATPLSTLKLDEYVHEGEKQNSGQ